MRWWPLSMGKNCYSTQKHHQSKTLFLSLYFFNDTSKLIVTIEKDSCKWGNCIANKNI